MYPDVLERSSALDTSPSSSARFKPIAQKHERRADVRARRRATSYWGVEETDWADAPILRRAAPAVHAEGRPQARSTHDGAQLHMVVLARRTASYWVVNTLLDALSNETMLAIAEGLQPLPG